MGLLRITQKKSKLSPTLAHYILIGGKRVCLMQSEVLNMELPNGTFEITIQSILKIFQSKAVVTITDSTDAFIDFSDKEKIWDILFILDIILWCIKGLFGLPDPYSLIYDIFTNGYLILWIGYELYIRGRYFKLDVYKKPSEIIDLTMPLSEEQKQSSSLSGHVGTHFDIMDKSLPGDKLRLKGIFFDVSSAGDGEITSSDIDMSLLGQGMLVGFYSGIQDRYEYGSESYRHNHPTLSYELIDKLIEKRIALIGIDFAGVRRHAEHTPADQKCADNGIFIIENLHSIESVLGEKKSSECFIYVELAPITGATGIPCHVSARTY
ncbi:MAG: cyclase family protein [Bacteroidales bacterium]|nr:cyclase family protein [Bacteroidales bacterium]